MKNLLLLKTSNETKIWHHHRKINLWDKLLKQNARYFFYFSSYTKLKLHLFSIFQSNCIPLLEAHSNYITKEYKSYLLNVILIPFIASIILRMSFESKATNTTTKRNLKVFNKEIKLKNSEYSEYLKLIFSTKFDEN